MQRGLPERTMARDASERANMVRRGEYCFAGRTVVRVQVITERTIIHHDTRTYIIETPLVPGTPGTWYYVKSSEGHRQQTKLPGTGTVANQYC